MKVIARDVDYYETPTLATVIKGMRRTGKTYVTYAHIQALISKGVELGRIIHLNFEDDRLRGMTVDRLHLIEEAHAELYPEFARAKKWFFLDELQDIVGWESYARRLVDTPNIQLCLTGSSSKLLSAEIATAMRGRAVPIEVFPLSFREFLRFNGIFSKLPPRGVYTTAEREALRHAMADAHASERRIAVQSLVSMHHMDIMQTNRISGNTSASAQKRASVSRRLPSFAGICSRRKVHPSRCLRS